MRVVAVVHGGTSLEHEVSCVSGREVLANLDSARYRALPVLIGRDGSWVVAGERRGGPLEGALALREARTDVCFLALHGPFGEGGTIQAFLDTIGMPYTGSGMVGSALALDKILAKRLLRAHGVPGAPDLTVPPASLSEVASTLGFPVVVKDPHQGSTLGLRMAADAMALAQAIDELGAQCPVLLVERREAGREITAAILDDEDGVPQSLPLVEIRARDGFFDYAEKYGPQGARKLVPAPLDERTTLALQECARTVHAALGLRGMSRTDFILRPQGDFVFLETNSIPGLTPTSLLPKAAAAAGIPFRDVLTRLVEGALSHAPSAVA